MIAKAVRTCSNVPIEFTHNVTKHEQLHWWECGHDYATETTERSEYNYVSISIDRGL